MDPFIDISNRTIESERLILRYWQMGDLSDFYEYASVPGVGEMAGWKHHESMEESKKILSLFMEEKDVFAIVSKAEEKVIGSLGLKKTWAEAFPEYQKLKMKEIGYVLSKDYWGRGLMTEAVRRIIRFCFDTEGIEALTVGHFIDNYRSKRVIEKCGFQYVGSGEFYSSQLQKSFPEMRYILLDSPNPM
ncbi:MAG TPA: GNAT family N-acetyltransferase [Flexilinea sp.]|nr:GNAT family N-acetyltransferase [Flexilinea sp.]